MNAPLSFPYPDLPTLGQTLPVAPGVSWLRMPLPFALDHINLWLLDEADGAVTAVDTGFALEEVKQAWKSALAGRRSGMRDACVAPSAGTRLCKAESGPQASDGDASPLKRVVVTHGHPDHLGLAAWLESEFGAPLWIPQAEYMTAHLVIAQVGPYAVTNMLDFFRAHGLDEERLAGLGQRGNSFRAGVPLLPATFRRIYPNETLRLGGRDWRVITGYGHAPEHAALYCAEIGVLISGDMLLPRISTNVPALSTMPLDNPLHCFLESIKDFLALPESTLVLPSHGRPFVGIHERVRQLQAHHESRCALALTHCVTPKTATELIPVLFERDIPDPHQVMFAMGEAIAHLNYLAHQGRLYRSTQDGVIRYQTQS